MCLKVEEVRPTAPGHSGSSGSLSQGSLESELLRQLSLPVDMTGDSQMSGGAEWSCKDSLNLNVHTKPALNRNHISHMYV